MKLDETRRYKLAQNSWQQAKHPETILTNDWHKSGDI